MRNFPGYATGAGRRSTHPTPTTRSGRAGCSHHAAAKRPLRPTAAQSAVVSHRQRVYAALFGPAPRGLRRPDTRPPAQPLRRAATLAPALGLARLLPHSPGQQAFWNQRSSKLNPVRAVADLLEPIFRTLSQVKKEPWALLPKLTSTEEPHLAMMLSLDKLWQIILGRPLTFTDQGPHYFGRRYELVEAHELPLNEPAGIGIEHLLHWRLSRRDRRSRDFSRLALLALALLRPILTYTEGDLLEVADLKPQAKEQFNEFLAERTPTGKTYPKRTLTHQQLSQITEDVTLNGPYSALLAYIHEQDRYGPDGACTYYEKLLCRWGQRFICHLPHDGNAEGMQRDRQLGRLRADTDRLLAQQPSQLERSAITFAQHVLCLYESWPEENDLFPRPTLAAFYNGRNQPGDGQHLLDFVQLVFSNNDRTGNFLVDYFDRALQAEDIESSIVVHHALPDGTLPLSYSGELQRDERYMIPTRFPVAVHETLMKLLKIDQYWGGINQLQLHRSYDFRHWFKSENKFLRRELGWLRYEFTKPKVKATLLEILGEEEDSTPHPLSTPRL